MRSVKVTLNLFSESKCKQFRSYGAPKPEVLSRLVKFFACGSSKREVWGSQNPFFLMQKGDQGIVFGMLCFQGCCAGSSWACKP